MFLLFDYIDVIYFPKAKYFTISYDRTQMARKQSTQKSQQLELTIESCNLTIDLN